MKDLEYSTSALFQVTASFMVLYVATVIVIFVPEFDHDLIRLTLLSVLFLVSFLFQFYILGQQVRLERKRREQLARLLEEQDRTARMLIRRDRALSQANEDLREIDKLKSEFVSVAAHQLRTPLSGLKWSLEMLSSEQAGTLNTKQKTLVLKSHESNERMISLVNNLLNADRIEAGRIEIEMTRVNIKDILDSVEYYIDPQAKEKNITITKEVSETPPIVKADPEKMREVIQNILENSVKYTEKEGNIQVAVDANEKEVKLTIKDDGIGIPEDQQKKIFTKFFRSDNAVKVKTEGSGLGLFVTKEIVERHGGSIWFESEEGEGTTFFVVLPAMKKGDEKS